MMIDWASCSKNVVLMYSLPCSVEMSFTVCTTHVLLHVSGINNPNRGVIVKWFRVRHRTGDVKVVGSIPSTALVSFGKTLIYMYLHQGVM